MIVFGSIGVKTIPYSYSYGEGIEYYIYYWKGSYTSDVRVSTLIYGVRDHYNHEGFSCGVRAVIKLKPRRADWGCR